MPIDLAISEQLWEERKQELCRSPTLIDAAAVLRAAQLRPPFIVEQRIPASAITFIVGKPGGFKSWLAYDLVLAVVQGRDWLGCSLSPDLPERPSALILNYDNPTGELGRRLMRLGMRPEDPIWFHSPESHALRLPEAHEDLRAIVEAKDPTIVVIDTFRQCTTGDENSSKEMAEVMGQIKVLKKRGAAVIVVHHTNKSTEAVGQAKVRGSVEITGSADAVIILDGSQATWDKHRSWQLNEMDATLQFEIVDVGDSTVVRGLE